MWPLEHEFFECFSLWNEKKTREEIGRCLILCLIFPEKDDIIIVYDMTKLGTEEKGIECYD